ncbi:DUF2252 family protein [Novosphingobium sp. BL-8H]|uniref:DUF2252 family protein n=1 Tax=Novosphingobium sp. BL-8H TaxID=3127640 RepID=UPI003757B741
MKDFGTSMAAFETDLKSRLGAEFYPPDIDKKHRKMARNPFLFLRATCWRWAEAAAAICPELMNAPPVPSVGDAHAGNFGLWRDAEARLVWGINDFDEAARLPYVLDLVRLCASVLLADDDADAGQTARSILEGYRAGLDDPTAFVLERHHLWLRNAFAATDDQREAFWAELEADSRDGPTAAMKRAMVAALPTPAPPVVYARRSAGAGSLGRARFVAFGSYRGGPIAVEAKALIPSCWTTAGEDGLAEKLAGNRWRSPDPFLSYQEHYVVRRLAPNSRKIDLSEANTGLRAKLLDAMGRELASIHLGLEPLRQPIVHDLEQRTDDWLATAAKRVAKWTEDEFEAFRAGSLKA